APARSGNDFAMAVPAPRAVWQIRSKRGPGNRNADNNDHGDDDRLNVTMKLALRGARDLGEVMLATSDFLLIPSQAMPYQAGLQAARKCAAGVRSRGKKHELGPPRPRVAIEVARAIHDSIDRANGGEMEKQCKAIPREFIDSTTKKYGPTADRAIFHSFKANETYEREKEIGQPAPAWPRGFSAFKMQEAMPGGLLGLNATKREGAGPRAAMERAVKSALRRRRWLQWQTGKPTYVGRLELLCEQAMMLPQR
ncbi:unnamed protein product, partial [Prorocentrum cordatum]